MSDQSPNPNDPNAQTPPGGPTPPHGPAEPVGYTGGAETNPEARTFGMLAHLLGILTSVIGPLIIWLIKKDEMPFVDRQGKEAINFQIWILIYGIVLGAVTCGVGGPIVWVVAVVFGILAAVTANKGEDYRYPLVPYRFLK